MKHLKIVIIILSLLCFIPMQTKSQGAGVKNKNLSGYIYKIIDDESVSNIFTAFAFDNNHNCITLSSHKIIPNGSTSRYEYYIEYLDNSDTLFIGRKKLWTPNEIIKNTNELVKSKYWKGKCFKIIWIDETEFSLTKDSKTYHYKRVGDKRIVCGENIIKYVSLPDDAPTEKERRQAYEIRRQMGIVESSH